MVKQQIVNKTIDKPIKKTRNDTLKIVRFIMALLIFCTHIDQLDTIQNTFIGALLRSCGRNIFRRVYFNYWILHGEITRGV